MPLDPMSDINGHREIMHRPRTDPATPGLQILCSSYTANMAETSSSYLCSSKRRFTVQSRLSEHVICSVLLFILSLDPPLFI